MENALANARLLSKSLEATGWYTCVSDIHRKKGEYTFKGVKEAVFGSEDETSADYNAGLPVVAFRFSDDFKKEYPHIKQQSVSTLLRVKQYIIPSKSQLGRRGAMRVRLLMFPRLPTSPERGQD